MASIRSGIGENMTESEAIEKLKNMRLYMQIEDENNDCKFTEDDYKANEMAIQALEKQIPKKPIFANNMMTKDKFLMCPCCEFRFPDSLVFLKTRCWNCGQKLDWSDEE